MQPAALIPWLDPETLIAAAGPWALLVVCFIIFAETGLLIGFLLPGDTLLIMAGLLSHASDVAPNGVFGINVWWVALLIALAAFLGGEVGYSSATRAAQQSSSAKNPACSASRTSNERTRSSRSTAA